MGADSGPKPDSSDAGPVDGAAGDSDGARERDAEQIDAARGPDAALAADAAANDDAANDAGGNLDAALTEDAGANDDATSDDAATDDAATDAATTDDAATDAATTDDAATDAAATDAAVSQSADAGSCPQAPNACGGCTSLAGSPGDACGQCGLGRYVCAGSDALSCSGGDALPASTGGVISIDDFEDGDGRLATAAGIRGKWGAVSDGSGIVFDPPPGAELVPANQGANGTSRSGHVSGSGFVFWGAGLAASLNDRGCGFDARAQTGITFFVKGTGTGTVAFSVATRQTVPILSGGTCAFACYDHFQVRLPLTPDWTAKTVPWAALAQSGWGTHVAFSPSDILYIQFSFDTGTTFDAFVDEVSFY